MNGTTKRYRFTFQPQGAGATRSCEVEAPNSLRAMAQANDRLHPDTDGRWMIEGKPSGLEASYRWSHAHA